MNDKCKMRLRGAALGLLAAGAVTAAGCGGGGGSSNGGGGGTPQIPSLVGTWKESGISSSGQTSPCPGSIPGIASCGDNDNLQFTSSGTVTNQFLDATSADPARMYIETGTYAVVNGQSGNTLTLNITQGGDDTDHNGQLDPSEVQADSALTANVIISFPDSTHFTLLLPAVPGAPAETDSYTKQ